MKKRLFTSILAISIIAVMTYGQSANSVTDLILKSYSARTFTSVPVSAGDLEVILKCGIKAPSASNRQPWKFIVVRELSLMQQMIGNVAEGNVLIVISGPEAQANSTVDFDCGLATENMTIAAQSLGLGARIYTGPIRNINATMKQTLQIPEGWRAVAVLKVGHIESNVDATSAASPRNSYDEVVTFLK
jgi:nitroreductase